MHRKLFIPGPVEVRKDVLERLAEPMIGHRTAEASELQLRISDKLRRLFYTEAEILLSTSSGSGLMEGALRTCTRNRAAVFSCGAFGERWHRMAVSSGIEADLYSIPWGQAFTAERVEEALSCGRYDLVALTHNETSTGVMNPLNEIATVMRNHPDTIWCVDAVSSAGGVKIEVDRLGIDILITSTQKALGLPPGLAICTFSEKALRAAREVKERGYYLDLLQLYNYIQEKRYQYPSTPNLPLMYALDYQLDRILEEGPEERFARHAEMADCVRDWAREHFDLFPPEEHASNTVTAVANTREISIAGLNEELGRKGYLISNGYGKLKEKTFRIAHMADTGLDEVRELLSCIRGLIWPDTNQQGR